MLSCQRQSFHFSSGTSSQIGARRLTAGRPSGPSDLGGVAAVDERRLGGGPGGLLVGDRELDLLGVQTWFCLRGAERRRVHKDYALCKVADHSGAVGAAVHPPVVPVAGEGADGRSAPLARASNPRSYAAATAAARSLTSSFS